MSARTLAYRAEFTGFRTNLLTNWPLQFTIEVRRTGRNKWQVFCDGSDVPFPKKSPIVALTFEEASARVSSHFSRQVSRWQVVTNA